MFSLQYQTRGSSHIQDLNIDLCVTFAKPFIFTVVHRVEVELFYKSNGVNFINTCFANISWNTEQVVIRPLGGSHSYYVVCLKYSGAMIISRNICLMLAWLLLLGLTLQS